VELFNLIAKLCFLIEETFFGNEERYCPFAGKTSLKAPIPYLMAMLICFCVFLNYGFVKMGSKAFEWLFPCARITVTWASSIVALFSTIREWPKGILNALGMANFNSVKF
jgi:hypothetical protein